MSWGTKKLSPTTATTLILRLWLSGATGLAQANPTRFGRPCPQVKVDRALTPLNLGNASTQPLAFVGSNRWPITDSLPLERVPAASNETAPAVLLLAGAPYFVVPGLLLKEDDLSSGTGHPSPYFVVPGLLLNENVPSHLP
ncbi:hypothetical protein QJQ45_002050 [Haematococcus lacustris]|nr:hypothetical protein QJQ45_002050 [Haematococcus lacustris]